MDNSDINVVDSDTRSSNKNPARRRVIITRPAAQAESWQAALDREGLDSLLIPALEIEPYEDGEQVQRVSALIQKLDEFFCLIFVSQNAVALGFDWIEDYWPQFPVDLHCLSIGAKTQAAASSRLSRLGVPQDKTEQNFSLMTSEELLEHPLLANIADKKILLFKGSGGRTKISDELSERGAEVSHCELYQRMLPQDSLALVSQSHINPARDILSIFSGESLENFQFLLSKAKVENWQTLPCVVPSKRVAQHAREMGFTRIFAANNAGEDEMLGALRAALNHK